jgi:hypothetical protein
VSLLVAGLSNTNSLVIDTPAAYIVIIYRYINILGKGLYRVLYKVLYNTRPPNIAN